MFELYYERLMGLKKSLALLGGSRPRQTSPFLQFFNIKIFFQYIYNILATYFPC